MAAIKKNREALTTERDEKIESLNIHDLKKYLCMKNGQNPEKCSECPGLVTCTAGQRAVVLMNIASKKSKKDATERMRQMLMIVCQKPNMVDWLMKQEGISRDTARTKLLYWARKNPDIAEQYGFNEKINAETKNKGNAHRQYDIDRRQRAMSEYTEAKSQPDPVAYIMQKDGLCYRSAYVKFREWEAKFKGAEPTNVDHETQKPEESENVSLEEFLNETVPEEPSEDGTATIISEDPRLFTVRMAPEERTGEEKEDRLYAEMRSRYWQLENERTEAEEKIRQLNERIQYIEKVQEAMRLTASEMGLKDAENRFKEKAKAE